MKIIWKRYFFITLILLIVANAFWIYKSIDFGVTYTYQQVTLDDKIRNIKLLGSLVVEGAKNYSKKDLLHILRKINPSAFIVEEENRINCEGVQFFFKNNVLVEVKG
jgi:hypothetical protein